MSHVSKFASRCAIVLRHPRATRGQATAEYVLVLLAAASVALVLIGWLARSGRIEALLDQVFDQITSQL